MISSLIRRAEHRQWYESACSASEPSMSAWRSGDPSVIGAMIDDVRRAPGDVFCRALVAQLSAHEPVKRRIYRCAVLPRQ